MRTNTLYPHKQVVNMEARCMPASPALANVTIISDAKNPDLIKCFAAVRVIIMFNWSKGLMSKHSEG